MIIEFIAAFAQHASSSPYYATIGPRKLARTLGQHAVLKRLDEQANIKLRILNAGSFAEGVEIRNRV